MKKIDGMIKRALIVIAILAIVIALASAMAKSQPDKTGIWGIMLIKQFEGVRLCRYNDAVGVPTIGYGHTKTVLQLPKCISGSKAERLLRDDLRDAEWCIRNKTQGDLSSTEYDALSSFIFNLGCGNYSRSTMLRKLNAGWRGDVIAAQFLRWNRAGGRVLRGLTLRRKAEAYLFLWEQ